jgi:predicted MPP superfamily phosphohydrolase
LLSEPERTLSWLHIGDLHSGLPTAADYWPTIRRKFLDDVESHCSENGAIDLVVFSGDLAQQGLADEFEAVKDDLRRLQSILQRYGPPPKYVFVPGNHDLERPGKHSMIKNLLPSYAGNPDIEEIIFDNEDSPPRRDLVKAFENYEAFVESLSSEFDILAGKKGLLPGETSATFEVKGLKVGIVGLNTTWSQISKEYGKEDLLFSVKQLKGAIGSDQYDWVEKNDINILVTHQPVDWLTPECQRIFKSEVATTALFDMMLNGHVHENDSVKIISGSSHSVQQFQVSSLFGIEKDGTTYRREHGYYFAKAIPDEGFVRIKPRVIVRGRGAAQEWSAVNDVAVSRDAKEIDVNVSFTHLKKKITS